jgi:ubiquinone/menaquinone biosynthesis C-methylase UbiE
MAVAALPVPTTLLPAVATQAVTSAPALDYTKIKAKQQITWASGDFSRVAARIVFYAEQLAESADLQANWRVLDVATGSGNAALAAARRGCDVVGVDYVPALLERGRIRAQAEHLPLQFVEGDAENLPFPDQSFDAVLSIYGTMFAPDHQRTARELVRVTRPGGTIALASWTPKGFIGETFKLIASYVPPAAGMQAPHLWGSEDHLRKLFGSAIKTMKSTVRTAVFPFASAEDNVDFFRTYYGPTLKLFENVGEARREQLTRDLANLARRFDRNNNADGPIAIAAEYLETIITLA